MVRKTEGAIAGIVRDGENGGRVRWLWDGNQAGP